MSSIRVDTDIIDQQQQNFQNIAKVLEGVSANIKGISKNLGWNHSISLKIQEDLNQYSKKVEDLAQRTNGFVASLSSISEKYKQTENSLLGNTSKNTVSNANTHGDSKSEENSWDEIFGNCIKVIGKAGIGGMILSGLLSGESNFIRWMQGGSTGASSISSLLKDGKSISSGARKLYDNAKKMQKLSRISPSQAWKTGIERFFGFDDTFKGCASKAKSFSTRVYNNYHKIAPEGIKTGGVKSILKSAGAILFSGLLNGISNYEEMKSGKINGGRAVAETVVETAVDVGLGYAMASLGAGVAAVMAAAVGAAPALAVGVTIVGASLLLDWAFKKGTGLILGEEKGVTETVSDLILDGAEAVIDNGKKLISGIGSFFKNVTSNKKKGFRPLLAM